MEEMAKRRGRPRAPAVDLRSLSVRQRRYQRDRDRSSVVETRVQELSAELDDRRKVHSRPGGENDGG